MAAFGFLLFFLLLVLLFPGMLNMDSAGMLKQAVTGQFNDWHSPAVSLLWRELNHLYPGPASLLAVGLALFVAGACRFARAATTAPAAAVAAMALLCLWPPILNDLALVGKDQALIACLMPFIALAWDAQRTGRLTPPRLIPLAALLLAASAVRPDSAVGMVPAFALLLRLPIGGRGKGFGWTLAGMLAVSGLLLGFALTMAFNRLVARAYVMFPIQTTLVHDLGGISARADSYIMPSYVDPNFDLTAIKQRYYPLSGDPLLFDMHNPIVKIVAEPADIRDLERTWMLAVLHHPGAYLRHRLATLSYLLDIETPQEFQLYQANTDQFAVKYQGLPQSMHAENPDNAVLALYRRDLMPVLLRTPMFRGYAYDLVLIALILLALYRRRGPRDAMILALGAGAVLHQGALLFASPAALFRYLYPSLLLVLAMTILTLAKPRAPEMSLGGQVDSG